MFICWNTGCMLCPWLVKCNSILASQFLQSFISSGVFLTTKILCKKGKGCVFVFKCFSIPSAISGACNSEEQLQKNPNLAIDTYIKRVDGAPCGNGTEIGLKDLLQNLSSMPRTGGRSC